MSDYILELKEACKTIKSYCDAHETCDACKFQIRDTGIVGCYIQDIPNSWPIDKIFGGEK